MIRGRFLGRELEALADDQPYLKGSNRPRRQDTKARIPHGTGTNYCDLERGKTIP